MPSFELTLVCTKSCEAPDGTFCTEEEKTVRKLVAAKDMADIIHDFQSEKAAGKWEYWMLKQIRRL
jgi:hypothetical protein